MITSMPVVQAQPPNTPFYPIQDLTLFKDYPTRAAWFIVSGIDTPAADPTKRPKFWFDSSLAAKALTDMVTYEYVDNSTPGAPAVKTITMTVAEAESLNLPGLPIYPPYVVQRTDAQEVLAGTSAEVNPYQLSYLADAQALAVAFGLNASAVSVQVNPAVSYGAETRRVYVISWNGGTVNVGLLLQEANNNGVGSPGLWDLHSNPTTPVWDPIVSLPPVFANATPWPDPIRPLLANEALAEASSFFSSAAAIVYRTDMPSVYNKATAPNLTPAAAPTGGALTPDQATMIAAINHKLDVIISFIPGASQVV